ncbi:hypothetical protein TNCV_3818071 [Trichonephila clavipes]|nr:hypothetical protein TNCV_3818071 [Trichonephila clavipes]
MFIGKGRRGEVFNGRGGVGYLCSRQSHSNMLQSRQQRDFAMEAYFSNGRWRLQCNVPFVVSWIFLHEVMFLIGNVLYGIRLRSEP